MFNQNFNQNQFQNMLFLMNCMYPGMGYNTGNYNNYNQQQLLNFMNNWMNMNPILVQLYQAQQNMNQINRMNFSNQNLNQPNVSGGGILPRNMQDINYNINPFDTGPKTNVTFTTQVGHKMNIICPINMKIKDLFVKYVTRLGLGPNVMGSSLFFLFNGGKLNINDERPIQALGGNIFGLNIVVLDIKGVIGS